MNSSSEELDDRGGFAPEFAHVTPVGVSTAGAEVVVYVIGSDNLKATTSRTESNLGWRALDIRRLFHSEPFVCQARESRVGIESVTA
jgi:hypothetical protein